MQSNPLILAYFKSDIFGKWVFLALFFLSIVSWVILLSKWKRVRRTKKCALLAKQSLHKSAPRLLSPEEHFEEKGQNPFFALYSTLHYHVVQQTEKNSQVTKEEYAWLSKHDIECLDFYLEESIYQLTHELDKGLPLLSSIVSLAPFLGLLGTVWGILIAFTGLQSSGGIGGNQSEVLSGIAMALSTTVFGLLVAIPALLGHSFFKSGISDIRASLERFATEWLSRVEKLYRRVE